MRKPDLILLDIGNVLLDVDFSRFLDGVALDNIAACLIDQQFCQGNIKYELDSGRISPVEFYHKLVATGLSRDIDYKEFQRYWCRIFSLRNDFEGVISTLYRQYKICIASDTDPLHFAYLEDNYSFISDIENHFLSFELGYIKNQKEYFNKIKCHKAVIGRRMILVDDKKQNCTTAEECAVEAIHFTSWEKTLKILSENA